ncbi:MAG: ABC transporter permease [Rhizobiaceae bacterium]
MKRYILKRVVQGIITLVGVSIVVFLLIHLNGDPVALLLPAEATPEAHAALRKELRLDEPLYVQYGIFLLNALQGDFGTSLRWNRPALEVFAERFPNTVLLASAAMAWSLLIGVTMGVMSAVHEGNWIDRIARIVATVGQATPVFWLGIMLILLFSVKLGWFPTSGIGGPQHLVLPSLTLGLAFAAGTMRLTRSTMLDVLDRDYIKLARIKGVPEHQVIVRHALLNALIPVFTVAAMDFVVLMSGTVITEYIFNWPGVGGLVAESIFARDYSTIQTTLLVLSIVIVVTNVIVDIVYTYIDPRIELE